MRYVKKSDIPYFVKLRNRSLGITYTALILCLGLIAYTVTPSLQELYATVDVPAPAHLQYIWQFVVVAMLILGTTAVYYFRKPVNTAQLNQKLKKYKQDEMILLNQVFDVQETLLAVGIFAGVFLLFLFLFIYPVFNLTSQF